MLSTYCLGFNYYPIADAFSTCHPPFYLPYASVTSNALSEPLNLLLLVLLLGVLLSVLRAHGGEIIKALSRVV